MRAGPTSTKRITVSTIRRLMAASVAAAAAVTLTACDAEQVGAAAVVGDKRLTVTQLQDEAVQIAGDPESGMQPTGDLTQLQLTLVDRYVRHEVLAEMARGEGIEVGDADIDARIEEQYLSQAPEDELNSLLAQNGYTDETFRTAVYDEMVVQELMGAVGGEQAFVESFNETVDDLGVEISPRYGTWGDQLQIVPASGSISEPADGDPAEGTLPPGVDQ
jgi:peptidyl-prolyl cis-trans isomerase SurA